MDPAISARVRSLSSLFRKWRRKDVNHHPSPHKYIARSVASRLAARVGGVNTFARENNMCSIYDLSDTASMHELAKCLSCVTLPFGEPIFTIR